MSAKIINGKALAETIIHKVSKTTEQRVQNQQRIPGLAVILLGDDHASKIYVSKKHEACEQAGILHRSYTLAQSTSKEALLELITRLNHDEAIDGILIQLPLPAHIPEMEIIEHIAPHKDVDGFHPYNVGRLALREPILRPCTPMGIMHLLRATQKPLQGLDATVVGASAIVGRPMALELLLAGCTVTLTHRFTRNLAECVRRADIVVVAVGKAELVKGAWIKPGALVIDVGINQGPNGRLVGDVDFEGARQRAAWITPVPGGVGPMTVACLIENTLYACEKHNT